jgi:hypothetical protein
VKLTDLTLGDLISMSKTEDEESAMAEQLIEPNNVTPFVRRG